MPALACLAAPLAACVQRYPRISVDKTNRNWLLWQRPLRDQKTDFRLVIYSHILPILKFWRRSVH